MNRLYFVINQFSITYSIRNKTKLVGHISTILSSIKLRRAYSPQFKPVSTVFHFSPKLGSIRLKVSEIYFHIGRSSSYLYKSIQMLTKNLIQEPHGGLKWHLANFRYLLFR